MLFAIDSLDEPSRRDWSALWDRMQPLQRISVAPGALLSGGQRRAPDVLRVESGFVKFVASTRTGNEIVLGWAGHGWPVGLDAVWCNRGNALTAVAVTPCVLSRAAARTVIQVTSTDVSLLRAVVAVQSAFLQLRPSTSR